MAEQADATDLKSVDLRIVRVQFPPKPLAKDSQRCSIGSVSATGIRPLTRECSSAGRASVFQTDGRGFESHRSLFA